MIIEIEDLFHVGITGIVKQSKSKGFLYYRGLYPNDLTIYICMLNNKRQVSYLMFNIRKNE